MSFGNSKKLKSIAFDLDTKALKENYTKGDWHNAYNDINSKQKALKHLKRQSKKPKVFLKVFQDNNSKNLTPS